MSAPIDKNNLGASHETLTLTLVRCDTPLASGTSVEIKPNIKVEHPNSTNGDRALGSVTGSA